jgi:hypothetical protein
MNHVTADSRPVFILCLGRLEDAVLEVVIPGHLDQSGRCAKEVGELSMKRCCDLYHHI